MYKPLLYISLSIVLVSANPVPATAEKSNDSDDYRTLVDMPPEAQRIMQQEMIAHLTTLNEVIALLNAGKLEKAAETAEKELGRSSMGKHRGTGKGPGRHMPMEMRNIGWSMHEAASELAKAAAAGEREKAYAALQEVTSACVACHHSYRTR